MKLNIHQKGISLLEILLVVLIAAGIVSLAVQYYSQTLRNTRVTATANLLQQISKAGREWLQIPNTAGVYHSDFSNLTDNAANGNGLDILVKGQLLACENGSCFTNPWGGVNKITVDTAYAQYMLVTISGMPVSDCHLLQQQMANIAPQGLPQQNYCQNNLGGNSTNYNIYL